MDKVQIYECVLICLSVIVGLAMDGRVRESSIHKFRDTFLALLLGLPIMGRIFGWW
jgi:hypothetical protein